jgi:hypothetical protein
MNQIHGMKVPPLMLEVIIRGLMVQKLSVPQSLLVHVSDEQRDI